MFYISTRGDQKKVTSAEAIRQGLAPDGGLYIDPSLKSRPFDWEACLRLSPLGMAEMILSHLLPGFEDMGTLVRRAYEGKFDSDELTPLVKVGDQYVLELFHGPTAAFKDVALSMLPQLVTAARRQEGVEDRIVILTATSGDTGKAALEGFHDVEGTGIIVFYPDAGVSPVQKAQMVTQTGANVKVCAVRGNFDDCQTGVKRAFAALTGDKLPAGCRLSSANSINIGRLAPQVVYYFIAYAELLKRGEIALGDKVDYVVPTGNFGDILAGYFAKLMGLPVGKLVCASNANNILTDFLRTGVLKNRFRTRKVVPSGAPTSEHSFSAAPSSTIRLPVKESLVLVITSTLATAAMLDKASPRNPRLEMRIRSSAFWILLVACRRKAMRSCSFSIPRPLSVTRINSIPPSLISTVMAVAPASTAFSTSSFTTLDGRSTTSPAAILSIVAESKTCI